MSAGPTLVKEGNAEIYKKDRDNFEEKEWRTFAFGDPIRPCPDFKEGTGLCENKKACNIFNCSPWHFFRKIRGRI